MVRELSAEKRGRFLNAALRLFVAKGVQNTSTAEIAKEAGTASGTLFLYFPTKQQLVNELVILISREESEHINHLLDPSMTVRDTFFTIWSGSIRWLLENMDAYQYSQQIRDSGLISEEAALKSGQYFRFYYDAIQKGLNEGSIKPFPVDLIGGFLYQGIVAVMNHIRMQPVPSNQEESIQQGFELFWDGISIKKDTTNQGSK
jgi:AcrR family transcriptional regulator